MFDLFGPVRPEKLTLGPCLLDAMAHQSGTLLGRIYYSTMITTPKYLNRWPKKPRIITLRGFCSKRILQENDVQA